MQTIVYSSRAILPEGQDPQVKPFWLTELANQAKVKNVHRNISGVLSYKRGRLIQLIEGEESRVNALFSKIRKDTRHRNVRTILRIENSQRVFMDWGMILEPDIQSSSIFRDFLHIHIEDLVQMGGIEADELLFFIDYIFNMSHQVKDLKSSLVN